MTVKRKDFQKIATTIHQFLLKLTDTYECAELRDSLNMSLLQLQKYYRKCQQRLQHTGRHNSDHNGSGYVSPRQSLRITLSRTSEALSPMTPYIEEPQYFHAHWTVLDEKAEQIRRSLSQENLSPQKSINTPPMHFAVTKADFELLTELFKEKKEVLEDQDCLGRTPLMYAVYYNQIDVVRWLLDNEADANSSDFSEITPLHWACFKGNVEAIKLLIKAGANINYQDSFGRSASHWACTCPSLEPLQLLTESNTKINQHDRNGLTPAMWACRLDHFSHLNILSQTKNQEIDHIDGYERDRNGRTIIHWAIRRQQPLECLKHLLNEETVLLKDDEGKTVLLLAAEQGALESCKVIIEKFGSKYIEDVDDNDRTSLILATSGGHGEVVNYLLENGANLKSKDKTGASCVDIARNQYLFYCQLIISSHIREIEKRKESIPSDCVDLIEKATNRHYSITDSRPLTRTPPRPPKSPSSQCKSPTMKRRLIKYKREESIENDEEMQNGFEAMNSDSLKMERRTSEQSENQYSEKGNCPNDKINLSENSNNMQYIESETVDYLDNDTGFQYHGSFAPLKSKNLDESLKLEKHADDHLNITELNPLLKPFNRAKKFNRIGANSVTPSNVAPVELSVQTPDADFSYQDGQAMKSSKTFTKKKKHKSGGVENLQKINYGASLEPINKNVLCEAIPKGRKNKSKDPRLLTNSLDRLENLNVYQDREIQNLESTNNLTSLDNISNRATLLPNGIVSKRLLSTAEPSFSGKDLFRENRNIDNVFGGSLYHESEKLHSKPPNKYISSLEYPVSSNRSKNGTSRF